MRGRIASTGSPTPTPGAVATCHLARRRPRCLASWTVSWLTFDDSGWLAVDLREGRVRLQQRTFSIEPIGALSFRVLDELEGTWSSVRLRAGPGSSLVVDYASSARARRAVEAWLVAVDARSPAAPSSPPRAELSPQWRALLGAIRRISAYP